MNSDELPSRDHVNKDSEIFKSRVANAVLDYMEAQSDSDLIECLEKASIFLTNILILRCGELSREKIASIL